MGDPESRSSWPTLIPMAQCVPFFELFLIDPEMLHTVMADYLDLVTWGPGKGDQD